MDGIDNAAGEITVVQLVDKYMNLRRDSKQNTQRAYGADNYCDDIEILLNTGLRVLELYGLTKADIDFNNRRIHINKQLCRTAEKPYFITDPKTKSGIRYIPMSAQVYLALRRVLEKRVIPKVEMLVDGYALTELYAVDATQNRKIVWE